MLRLTSFFLLLSSWKHYFWKLTLFALWKMTVRARAINTGCAQLRLLSFSTFLVKLIKIIVCAYLSFSLLWPAAAEAKLHSPPFDVGVYEIVGPFWIFFSKFATHKYKVDSAVWSDSSQKNVYLRCARAQPSGAVSLPSLLGARPPFVVSYNWGGAGGGVPTLA